jgi:dynactin 1
VRKVHGTPPWVVRVDEIKASLAVNVEAERKVTQLNEEMQGLVRTLKTKDQHIQETAVKVELMERRMEGVKKQADTIADLEAELVKARKQERSYEDAIEQLQGDLDTMEQENTKLKQAGGGHERKPSGVPIPDVESVTVEGNLETSYLLEQASNCIHLLKFMLSIVIDRRFPWCSALLTHGEFVSQRSRPLTRNPGTTAFTRTCCTLLNTSIGQVWAVRHGRIR